MTENNYNLFNDINEIYEKYPVEKERLYRGNHFAIKMRSEINDHFKNFVVNNIEDNVLYKIKTHTGVGNWTNFPWIGIRNSKITTSFQNGIYIDIIINLYDRQHGLEMKIVHGILDNPFSQENITNIFNNIIKNNPIPAGFTPYTGEGFDLIDKTYNIDDLTEETLEKELYIILNYYDNIVDEYKELTTGDIINDLKEIYEKFPIEQQKPLRNNDFANKMRNEINQDFNIFISENVNNFDNYDIKTHCGMGSWTNQPWIGIRNTDVTTSFQNGIYVGISVNFNDKKHEIHLDLTHAKNYCPFEKDEIEDIFNELLKNIKISYDSFTNGYDKYIILTKSYDINNLEEENFINDLITLLRIYEEVIPEYKKLINVENSEVETIDANIQLDDDFNVWKISPGEKNVSLEVWQEFKDGNYVGIGWHELNKIHTDFRDFKSKDEIKDALLKMYKDTTKNSLAPFMIWNFIHEINIGDYVVVNYGKSSFLGIGKVISDYIPSNESDIENKRNLNQIRMVKWLITEKTFVQKNLFVRNTVNQIKSNKWNMILGAYSKNHQEYSIKMLNFLFDSYKKDYLITESQKHKNYQDNKENIPVSQNIIDAVNLLNPFVIDNPIEEELKINENITENRILQKFLDQINKTIPELSDPVCFNEFCNYLCDSEQGNYATGKPLPLLNFDTEIIESKYETIPQNNEFNLSSDMLKTNLEIKHSTINQLCAMLNSGKHIILEGIPGTGKTELGIDIGNALKENNFCNGYILTTATSDWNTFDTIGGLMPDEQGNLQFNEGIFLRSIRENKLLIIDEINRADIDKAFGQLFTVLSGQNIELNYKINNKPIKVEVLKDSSFNTSYYDKNTATYKVGKNWRIIASMNTSDKDSLFEMSYAFMRRFAFVNIEIPTQETYSKLISKWTTELNPVYKQKIINLEELFNSKNYPKIGPAIFKDICNYLTYRKDFDNNEYMLDEAITSFILPQFEGLGIKQLNQIYNDFINIIGLNDEIIKHNMEEILGIPLKLGSNKNE